MRLFLTLLALLSGWSFSDRAVAAPLSPTAMGAMVLLADSNGQADVKSDRRRPAEAQKDRRMSSGTPRHGRKTAPPHLPGLLPGVDRAIE